MSAWSCLKARVGYQESCAFNDECIAPQVCAGRRCRAPCRTHRDCTAEWRCATSGLPNVRVCIAPEQNALCGSSTDCEDRRTVCAPDGECRAQCKTSYDCVVNGLGTVCRAGVCDRSACGRGLCDDGGSLLGGAPDAPDATGPADLGPTPDGAPVDGAADLGPTPVDGTVTPDAPDGARDGASDATPDAAPPARTCGLVSEAGACTPGAPGCDVVAVASGQAASCAAFSDGSVRCWGGNNDGQLGVGTMSTCFFPGLIPGFGGVTSVAAGGSSFCARRRGERYVWCWGSNFRGELGTGIGTPARAVPSQSLGFDGVVYGGNSHACVVTPTSEVQCWGANADGQLGGGGLAMLDAYFAPIRANASGAQTLALGFQHSCAVFPSGRVGCWGSNRRGQGGQPSAMTILRDVQLVPGLPEAQKLVAGSDFTCALGRDGQVRCWGDNARGQLGRGPAGPAMDPTPAAVTGLTDVMDVAAMSAGACALRRDGTVWCWGDAEVSRSPTAPVGLPSAVGDLTGVRALFGRCAWRGGADLRCWGSAPGDGTASATDRAAAVRWGS
ncbi:MAG: hypothetical protein HY909_05255 [Deltaproteobacteria bacterium]|nr:hypothetical protein [Deltaproteobacteria bacterium]